MYGFRYRLVDGFSGWRIRKFFFIMFIFFNEIRIVLLFESERGG